MRLEQFRNALALENDKEQVCFTNMLIKALQECPDQEEEIGEKHIFDTEQFQAASREPIPPLAGEPRELIELDDELLEDPTIASLTEEDADTQNSEDNSQNEAEENDELIAMQYHL